jgi:hypothetical protein
MIETFKASFETGWLRTQLLVAEMSAPGRDFFPTILRTD